MSGQWQPGDVGVSVSFGYRGIFVSGHCRSHDRTGCWHNESGLADPPDDNRRPLIVLDPESDRDVARMENALEAQGRLVGTSVQAALRSLVAPPRPDEPTDFAARAVTDGGTQHWARVMTVRGPHWVTDGGVGITWDELVTDHPDVEVQR